MVPTDGVFQSVLDGWPESSFPHHHLWYSPPHPLWTDDAWDPGEVSNIQEDVPKPSGDREIWLECSMSQEAVVLWEWTRGPPAAPSTPPCLPRSSSLLELYHTCHLTPPSFPGCPGAGSFHVWKFLRLSVKRKCLSCPLHRERGIRSRPSRRVSSLEPWMGETTMGTPWEGLAFSHLI